MNPESLQAYASLAGLAVTVVGIPFLILQIRDLQRSVRSGAHASMYAQGADFRAHLVAYPHLRKYFFDGVDVDPDNEEHDRILTIAELFLNHLEHIAVMIDSFGHENREALERFVRTALDRSPIMQRRLTENRVAYSHALLGLAGRPATSARSPAPVI
jgi:hypothetical protein